MAAYFCAPDGKVLHVVAGPVNAQTMLREAQWVVNTTKQAIEHAKKAKSKNDAIDLGREFRIYFRKEHAKRARNEHGVVIQPVVNDFLIDQDPESALTYRDPTGQPLAPKLPPAPINGPDVNLRVLQVREAKALGARAFRCGVGGRVVLGNQGQVHRLMAAHSLTKIEDVYGAVFEGILGEQISTRPIEIVNPFPWVKNR